nr:MAG TPA: hypothetical protein [Caudoviricetes sp.]
MYNLHLLYYTMFILLYILTAIACVVFNDFIYSYIKTHIGIQHRFTRLLVSLGLMSLV